LARVIAISNRVSVPAKGNVTRAGGLEVALAAVFATNPGIWFGWSGRIIADDSEPKTQTTEANGQQYTVIDLTKADHNEYYNGFANRVLWPILHYRLDLADYSLRDLSGYFRVNQRFADELSKLIAPDDILWVHDYHLMPLAKSLRQLGFENRIGFFLHTPLPPPEVLTALPSHEKLFPALCYYDLVGFQTEIERTNFARYLISECRYPSRDLKSFLVDGRNVALGVYPVGISVEELRRWSVHSNESALVTRVRASLVEREMIIGVDRLDYSKGIPARMEGFERFLAQNKDWHNKVTFLQITPRSRSEVREYRELNRQVDTAVGRINGTFGEADWTPIRYVNQSYARSTLAGLYRSAKAALVTPLRDGMNLVAKEYVAAQSDHDPGVLILSRFAGASRECDGALIVNPYDIESISQAIKLAFEMPLEERRSRHQATLRRLTQNDIKDWGKRFIADLEEADVTQSLLAKASVTKLMTAKKRAQP
jgi:trehalose 6-phosphate synthase